MRLQAYKQSTYYWQGYTFVTRGTPLFRQLVRQGTFQLAKPTHESLQKIDRLSWQAGLPVTTGRADQWRSTGASSWYLRRG